MTDRITIVLKHNHGLHRLVTGTVEISAQGKPTIRLSGRYRRILTAGELNQVLKLIYDSWLVRRRCSGS
jgi:hypothetical protein